MCGPADASQRTRLAHGPYVADHDPRGGAVLDHAHSLAAALSGWIKVEKDLANDPRVLRMASRLRHADVTLGSRSRLVIVGALVTLWWYADTHILDDDTLPIGADQINELVGVDGFCDLMPPKWLEILDTNNVKLVDYTAHNGTTAKKRALGQRRKERSRSRHADVTHESRSSHSNCVTRLDLDLDKTKKEEGEREVRAARSTLATRLPADFGLTPERRAIAEAEKADPDREFAQFTDHFRAAPGVKGRKNDWDATRRTSSRAMVPRPGLLH
jgi:hypothetical protein